MGSLLGHMALHGGVALATDVFQRAPTHLDAHDQHATDELAHAGGAWGTALAMHASLRHDTVVYARETEVVEAINDPSIRENTTFLKVSIAFFYAPFVSAAGRPCHATFNNTSSQG